MNKILLIYTGGTIGMKKDAGGVLAPVNFSNIEKHVPAIKQLGVEIDIHSFSPLIDSSNVNGDLWIKIATTVSDNYDDYCGFVIMHGTDTMAYTSSILSYMLQRLNKPVVLTGSQLPIGSLRSDGRANLITAIEIASAGVRQHTIVPEVSVCFDQFLYRGNRVTKHLANNFNAFKSYNYPPLASVGINIDYNDSVILPPSDTLKTYLNIDNKLKTIRLHPCMRESKFDKTSGEDIRAIILETYGTGNAPTFPWFLRKIEKAISEGIVVTNISQCPGGHVEMGVYETSKTLQDIGVINGGDMTEEAAITKLMHLLGTFKDNNIVKELFQQDLVGEMNRIYE